MKTYLLYLFFILFVLVGCTRAELSTISVSFSLLPESNSPTRANDPDEDRIADYNLFIFNAYGLLEEKVYVSSRQLETENGVVTHHTRLMQNVPYTPAAPWRRPRPIATIWPTRTSSRRAFPWRLSWITSGWVKTGTSPCP